MPNIVLMGATYPDVPSIILPTSNNETAQFYDMDNDLSWMGADVQLISENWYEKVDKLKNTAFNGWEPSSTAKVCVASVTLSNNKFVATDVDKYVYYIIWTCGIDVAYTGTPVQTAMPMFGRAFLVQCLYQRPGSWVAIQSRDNSSTANVNVFNSSFLRYYGTTTGSLTYTFAASYGLYFAGAAPSISNATAVSPTITPKTPTLSARTSNTYMSASNAGLIDQDNTKWWIQGSKVYRAKRDCFYDGIYKGVVDCVLATPPELQGE